MRRCIVAVHPGAAGCDLGDAIRAARRYYTDNGNNSLKSQAIATVRDMEALRDAGSSDAEIDSLVRDAFMDAIVRLQFGDRLTQRLANVCNNLVAAAAFLDADARSETRPELCELLATVRSSFTMEEEREQFDAAFPSMSNGSSHG